MSFNNQWYQNYQKLRNGGTVCQCEPKKKGRCNKKCCYVPDCKPKPCCPPQEYVMKCESGKECIPYQCPMPEFTKPKPTPLTFEACLSTEQEVMCREGDPQCCIGRSTAFDEYGRVDRSMRNDIQAPAWGKFTIQFDRALTRVYFKVYIWNGCKITQARIHFGKTYQNGQTVAFLYNNAPIVTEVGCSCSGTPAFIGGPGGCDVNGLLNQGVILNCDIVTPDPCVTGCLDGAQQDDDEDEACDTEKSNAQQGYIRAPQSTVINIASLYEAILNENIYVNIYSEGKPLGALRGQIFTGK